MVNPRWFERYVDFAVLLVLAGLALTAQALPSRGDRERWLLAGVIAVASFFAAQRRWTSRPRQARRNARAKEGGGA